MFPFLSKVTLRVGERTAPIRTVQTHPSPGTWSRLARKPKVNLKVKGRRDGFQLKALKRMNSNGSFCFSNVPFTFEYFPRQFTHTWLFSPLSSLYKISLKGRSHYTFSFIDLHSNECECVRSETQAHAKSLAFCCVPKFKFGEFWAANSHHVNTCDQ